MFAAPSLQVIKNLINEICGGSCDNLCFVVVDAMMSLPVVVDRLHPAHGGKTSRAQWTSEMMLRTILGQQRKHSPKNGSLYLPGSGDLFGPAIFNAVSRAVCASMMQVRDAACDGPFCKFNKTLCCGAESQKQWVLQYKPQTTLFDAAIQTAHKTGCCVERDCVVWNATVC